MKDDVFLSELQVIKGLIKPLLMAHYRVTPHVRRADGATKWLIFLTALPSGMAHIFRQRMPAGTSPIFRLRYLRDRLTFSEYTYPLELPTFLGCTYILDRPSYLEAQTIGTAHISRLQFFSGRPTFLYFISGIGPRKSLETHISYR